MQQNNCHTFNLAIRQYHARKTQNRRNLWKSPWHYYTGPAICSKQTIPDNLRQQPPNLLAIIHWSLKSLRQCHSITSIRQSRTRSSIHHRGWPQQSSQRVKTLKSRHQGKNKNSTKWTTDAICRDTRVRRFTKQERLTSPSDKGRTTTCNS